MTAERRVFEPAAEAPIEPRKAYEKPAIKKPELSQEQQDHLSRDTMIQLVVMRQENIPIELRIQEANYIKDKPGTWRDFKPKSCDVIDDWIEKGVWNFVFRLTTDGPDNGWEVTEKIPLSIDTPPSQE